MINIEANGCLSKEGREDGSKEGRKRQRERGRNRERIKGTEKLIWMIPFVNFYASVSFRKQCVCWSCVCVHARVHTHMYVPL